MTSNNGEVTAETKWHLSPIQVSHRRAAPSSSHSSERAGRGRCEPAEHGQGNRSRSSGSLAQLQVQRGGCGYGCGARWVDARHPLGANSPTPPRRSRCRRALRARERSQWCWRPEENLLRGQAKEEVEACSSSTEEIGGVRLVGDRSVQCCLAAVVGTWVGKRTCVSRDFPASDHAQLWYRPYSNARDMWFHVRLIDPGESAEWRAVDSATSQLGLSAHNLLLSRKRLAEISGSFAWRRGRDLVGVTIPAAFLTRRALLGPLRSPKLSLPCTVRVRRTTMSGCIGCGPIPWW